MSDFPIITVKSGSRDIKGYLVLNPGKNNGVLIRRDTGIMSGYKYDKIEIDEVFQTKGSKGAPQRWSLQYKKDPEKKYGYPAAIRFPIENIANVVECLNMLYKEIYGKERVVDSVEPPVKKEPPEDVTDSMQEYAKKHGIY